MSAADSTKGVSEPSSTKSAIVVDMGAHRRARIRQLRRGRGRLMEQVNSLLDELRTDGSISAGAQPVVVVVRQRRRPRSVLWPLVP
jgi:hypothetical protein